jgi:fatty acid desaturase
VSTTPRVHDTVFPGSPRLAGVVSDAGEPWDVVRRRLVPRYGRVWGDIAAYYAALLVGFAAHCLLTASAGTVVGVVTAPLFALWLGYWIAALVNFVHEAAHFNLHRDKRTNDRLADWLICPLAGTSIAPYRDLHWRHHLHLGTPRDTEVSYRERPGARFVMRALLGLKIIEVLRNRQRSEPRETAAKRGGQAFGLLRSVALHAGIIAAAALAGLYGPALAWAMAAGMVYPFFNALRQTLEHRPDDAGAAEGEQVGAVNRLFGTDPLSRSFGAAGFNRHLLHHWHPSASYTTFDELESFLLSTPLAASLEAARTTYGEAWYRLAKR